MSSDHGTFKYKGIPLLADIGSVFGNTYFVDARSGSVSNTGKTPDKAKALWSQAYTLATSNNNDAIFIDGDSEHTETTMLDWTKNRIHTYGCNGAPPGVGMGCGARVSMGTTGVATDIATLKNTGVRNTFTGLKISNSSATTTNLYTVAEGGEYTRFSNCEIYKSGLLLTDGTAELLMNGDTSQFYNCTIGSLENTRGASGKECPCVMLTLLSITDKMCRDGWFEDCRFLTKAAHQDVCHVYGVGAQCVTRSLVFKNCTFENALLAAATVADAINFDTAQTAGHVLVINPAGVNVSAIAGASLKIYVSSGTAQTTDGVSEEIAA